MTLALALLGAMTVAVLLYGLPGIAKAWVRRLRPPPGPSRPTPRITTAEDGRCMVTDGTRSAYGDTPADAVRAFWGEP